MNPQNQTEELTRVHTNIVNNTIDASWCVAFLFLQFFTCVWYAIHNDTHKLSFLFHFKCAHCNAYEGTFFAPDHFCMVRVSVDVETEKKKYIEMIYDETNLTSRARARARSHSVAVLRIFLP